MTNYDYIILGAGASGLMLAYRMALDEFFDDKSILIIDKETQKGNDRTWCFWENGIGEWDGILTKTWSKIYFGSDNFKREINILPYQYKMIRSKDFYNSLWDIVCKKSNFTFQLTNITSFQETKSGAEVVTVEREGITGPILKETKYQCKKVFTSLSNFEAFNFQEKYPVINQHFLGWFIKTEDAVFDDTTATFMDFTVPQKGNTRFMYVLPLDTKTALIEYTLFSKNLLSRSDYEAAIKQYLTEKGINNYRIIESEIGSIPMTSYKFSQLNTKHILNIGTAGGWTKASTGYTFRNTSKNTRALVEFLKTDNDLRKFHKKSKFWFYDLIFLDVLANHNEEGAVLFASMFKKADVKTIFKFLDEESTIYEDLRIILSVPPKRFIQSFFKRLF
ncbi:lycopene cyclase [Winogradskyella sp. J14-2]|uniref:lycopene cyclase family protein n=1 Tax=Winogradskyella sp. J14-2 TaxID=1936080 RepID=UPI0009729373|nr:lycopene cyclase family protein [Winogradskyella sp. J14-2]APY07520.1 lycopene cyclase [Winogradskyella sp. J14-2]